MRRDVVILGAGISGLAAAYATRGVAYEAEETVGGLCCSYRCRPSGVRVRDDDAHGYRFEVGGGHWIFERSERLDAFLERFGRPRTYSRRAAVRLNRLGVTLPYPLQHHVGDLPPDLRRHIDSDPPPVGEPRSMRDWLEWQYGRTLCDTFFHPFHEAYTAGLYARLAPQDPHKSPQRRGVGAARDVGYNVSFRYPEVGLGRVVEGLAREARIALGHRATSVDLRERVVHFENGAAAPYETLISTIPLHRFLSLAGVLVDVPEDPWTSLLVINLGAARGPRCPRDHWVYLDSTTSGFHRIGFYSNVDESFLPPSRRGGNYVSAYVERAFAAGQRCDGESRRRYVAAVIEELRDWQFIDDVEVVDESWVETAYTWSWIDSDWRRRALAALANHGVHAVGRFGRWHFQGIGASFEEGLATGELPGLSKNRP